MTNKIESQRLTNSQISAKLSGLRMDITETTARLVKMHKDEEKLEKVSLKAEKHLSAMVEDDKVEAMDEAALSKETQSRVRKVWDHAKTLLIGLAIIASIIGGIYWFQFRPKPEPTDAPAVEQTVQPIQDDWSINDEL